MISLIFIVIYKKKDNLIEIELGYLNINHPDFLGGSNALVLIMEKLNEEEKNEESVNE